MASAAGEAAMAGEANDAFGVLLKRHRLAAGLTQEGLAERSGISARAVSDLERDEGRAPRLGTVGLLAGALTLTDAQRAALLAAARPDAEAPSRLTSQPLPSIAVPEPPSLYGRHHEQAQLRASLDAALAGRGGLVLIGGEAGIGKTALAEALLHDAAGRGALVLAGRCYDLAEMPPYGPWIDLFLHLPVAGDMPPLPPAFAARGTVGAVASQMALFAQVEDFLTALATSRPTVVLLDDLHWADPASLDLLRFVSRSVAALPLLILATYRPDEVTRRHPLVPLLPQLAREAATQRLDLTRLDDGAVRALVDARYSLSSADAARLVAYLRVRAEGNAFFVGELSRALEEGGTLEREGKGWRLGDLADASIPALLRQVIEARVARLDEGTQRLLAVAAVIGHEVPLDVWATVGECAEDVLLAAIEDGLEARLLAEAMGGEGMQFAHALIRETLYEQLSGVRRRRVHRRVAETLAAGRIPDPDTVASHFQRAGDARALPWLIQAGERAQAAYSFVTAAARFEAALALMEQGDADADERGWLLLRSSRLLRHANVAKARGFADDALALGLAAKDSVLTAYAQFQRGMAACFAGDVVHGLPELEAGAEALAALSASERAHFAAHAAAIDAESRRPEGRGMVVAWRNVVGRYREARALGERLVAEVDGSDEAAVQSIQDGYAGLGEVYAMLGMPDEGAAMYAIGHDAFLRAGHHVIASLTSWRQLALVVLPYRTENIVERQRLAERMECEHERASGAIPAAVPARFLRLPLLVLEGQWEEAERLALIASTEARGNIVFRTMALRYLAVLARLRGDAERAWWAVRERLPRGPATEPGTVAHVGGVLAAQQVAVALALDAGDLATAREWLETHDYWLAWSGSVLGQSEGQALWAQYHIQAGDINAAYEHAERAFTYASAPRQPLALLAAHRLLGELATDAERHATAEEHLAESLRLADACAALYERALTLLAMAGLRAATGNNGNAKRLLGEVQAICEPLGAKPALARATTLTDRIKQASRSQSQRGTVF